MDDIYLLVFSIALAIAALVSSILFLRTLYNLISRCAPENRTIEPTQIWFLFIPIFNLFWNFVVVNRIASTLDREFTSRRISEEDEPGKVSGVLMCTLVLLNVLVPYAFGKFTLYVSFITLGFFISYWSKMSYYSKELAEPYDSMNNRDETFEYNFSKEKSYDRLEICRDCKTDKLISIEDLQQGYFVCERCGKKNTVKKK